MTTHKLYNDYESLVNVVSIKYKIEPKVVIKIMHHVFKETKSCMSDDLLPNILLHNFGRIKPRPYDITKMIKKLHNGVLYIIENNGSPLTLQTKLERLKVLVESYKRIVLEERIENPLDLNNIVEIIERYKDYGTDN